MVTCEKCRSSFSVENNAKGIACPSCGTLIANDQVSMKPDFKLNPQQDAQQTIDSDVASPSQSSFDDTTMIGVGKAASSQSPKLDLPSAPDSNELLFDDLFSDTPKHKPSPNVTGNISGNSPQNYQKNYKDTLSDTLNNIFDDIAGDSPASTSPTSPSTQPSNAHTNLPAPVPTVPPTLLPDTPDNLPVSVATGNPHTHRNQIANLPAPVSTSGKFSPSLDPFDNLPANIPNTARSHNKRVEIANLPAPAIPKLPQQERSNQPPPIPNSSSSTSVPSAYEEGAMPDISLSLTPRDNRHHQDTPSDKQLHQTSTMAPNPPSATPTDAESNEAELDLSTLSLSLDNLDGSNSIDHNNSNIALSSDDNISLSLDDNESASPEKESTLADIFSTGTDDSFADNGVLSLDDGALSLDDGILDLANPLDIGLETDSASKDTPDLALEDASLPTDTADSDDAFLPPSARENVLDLSFNESATSSEEAITEKEKAEGLGIQSQVGSVKVTIAKGAAQIAAEEKKYRLTKRKILAVSSVSLIAILLGVGGYLYQKEFKQKRAQAVLVSRTFTNIEKLVLSDKTGHWLQAAANADTILKLEPDNTRARALAAQAYFASYRDDATDPTARNKGSAQIKELDKTQSTSPEVERARGLASLVEGDVGRSIERLSALLLTDDNNQNTLLYLGWAHLDGEQYEDAYKVFDAAIKKQSSRRNPEIFGAAESLRGMGKYEQAYELYMKLLKRSPQHVGAQLGKAASSTVGSFSQREAALLSILRRKDLTSIDQRSVARIWALAGEVALRSSRLDVAETRFMEALNINPNNMEALVGLAEVELWDGRLVRTRERLEEARTKRPVFVAADILEARLLLAEGEPQKALALVDELIQRKPPLSQKYLEESMLVRGEVLVTNKDTRTEGIKAYQTAISLTQGQSLGPIVALAAVYSRYGQAQEAIDLIAPLERRAQADGELAITLGVVYLAIKELNLAEKWFLHAVNTQEDNVEALLQLAETLVLQGRLEASIPHFKSAYGKDPTREDIGLRLCSVYEDLGREKEATTMYNWLLEKESTLNAKVLAGRFFVGIEDLSRAEKLGEQILAEQTNHPGGLYLRGVGQEHKKSLNAARDSYKRAATLDSKPEYYLALGRVAETIKDYKTALTAYEQATIGQPSLVLAWKGLGRSQLAKQDPEAALVSLQQADTLAPLDPEIHYMLGLSYKDLAQNELAMARFKNAIKLDKENAESYYELSLIYAEKNNASQVARNLESATKYSKDSHPWRQSAFRRLGYAYYDTGNRRGAIRAWRNYLDSVKIESVESREVTSLMHGLENNIRRRR